MTTAVNIRASNHDVEVRKYNKRGRKQGETEIITKGEDRTYYVHQDLKLRIKEVDDNG